MQSKKMLWLTALATSAALTAAPSASAETIALYDFSEFSQTQADSYDNVTDDAPYNNQVSSSLASVTGLDLTGLEVLAADTTRDSTNEPLGSIGLLVGPGSIAHGSTPTPPSPTSSDDYYSTVITANTTLDLVEFSFDMGSSAGEGTNASNTNGDFTTAEVNAQLYYSLDGGGTFTAIGDLHKSIADNADNEGAFTGMDTYTVDLSSLGSLNNGDSIEFRLALSNNRGSPTTSVGHYFDNVAVSAVPEPASLALLALGGLAMLGRRRR